MKKEHQNESEDHHFVPQTYLRKFPKQPNCAKVCVANKHEEDKVFYALPRSICFKKHLYRLEGKTQEERQVVERFYSVQIESDYPKIYDLLVDPNKVDITKQERKSIIMTIISLYLRNIVWLTQRNIVFDRAIEEAHQIMLQSGGNKIVFPFGVMNCEGKSVSDIKREVAEHNRQRFAIEHLLYVYRLVDLRIEDNITVIKLEDGMAYITSDNPVVILGRDSQIVPFNVENIISLPIDPKHQVLINPKSWGCGKDGISRWTASGNIGSVQEMINNGNQYKNAHNLIIGSQSGIENFKKLKLSYFKVATQEQLEQDGKKFHKIIELMQKLGIKTDWFRGDIFPK